MFSTLSIHWFNPLVWVMYILSKRDLTLLCDMFNTCSDGENKYGYALSLIEKLDTWSESDSSDKT